MQLDAIPREWLLIVAAGALFWVFVLCARRWAARARMRRRFDRGAEGEREALALLEKHGFRIEAAQVATSYELAVDGAPVSVTVRADYVVTRGGERFVAEVKTGALATRPETTATRRQLLEYRHAFDVSGVLLVDADSRRIQKVEFY